MYDVEYDEERMKEKNSHIFSRNPIVSEWNYCV